LEHSHTHEHHEGDEDDAASDSTAVESEHHQHADPEAPQMRVFGAFKAEEDVDLEKAEIEKAAAKEADLLKDPNVVSWDGEDDPECPKNWTMKRKWAATFVVSSFTFISPVSSSMIAPALPAMMKEFGVTEQIQGQLMLSIFILAYAVGPLFLGPLSEIFGRVPTIQLANLFYLAFNIGCGEAKTSGQMIAFRFLAGLGGSAPLAIGGGVLADVFRAEERGKAVSIYSLAPLLGPAVGPIAGGFITASVSWRWIFRAVSIADFLIQIVGFFFLRETYAPVLLERKTERLRKETNNPKLRSEFDRGDKTLYAVLKTSFSRPFILLGTQPIIQALAVYMAFLYGLMYLVLASFPSLWENQYHMKLQIGSLNYIALGLGFFLGAQICAPLNDKIYRKLKIKNNNTGKPEFRVPLMQVGAALVPIGLIIYGWCANYRVYWLATDIGACLFTAGTIIGFQCIQTYLVDAYTRYAASAIGAATVLRSLAGFGFPLFAPALYRAVSLSLLSYLVC